ncbi:acyl-[acyl-carrier-protein]--UDP-N-acetylglucosamine O-acyltransferase [Brumimicrobium salinarum]|uniref:Acyl-[acyl-carrier-protein]--UDP-N-acetylglucosamine O-acyltransferase n=1 Tax=Brumimicrobium salinarum TaxID=2058658 RepID=A0A2I0R0A2_9FLAO|nr:acyl-ACP--UDP-N-acetylglucosamine O-acyltransferase [Brumimicrobium salinarum]PKR79997.1 acyl-[acyl-carrier-protein]--UDP-N-acetylglucosamine O-acyltransferase [Brumimicrobium salinarum]
MINPLASVSSNAKIGENVTIEAFTSIYEDVKIGDGTHIGPNVTIYPGTRIGENCKIFPGAVIGAVPQDLKFGGEYTTVEIGSNTTIRECVTIHRGTTDKMKTSVGDNCLLMGYVHVAHDCQLGNNVILANYVGLSGHVTIDDYAIIEGKAAAQQFVHIGAHSFVAGASLIRKNIPPFVRAAREPLSYAGINAVGLRRRNFIEEDIKTIEDIYRILFVQNNNISNGLQALENELPKSELKKQVTQFVKNSEKGIIRGLM